jgi:hypothetical protein
MYNRIVFLVVVSFSYILKKVINQYSVDISAVFPFCSYWARIPRPNSGSSERARTSLRISWTKMRFLDVHVLTKTNTIIKTPAMAPAMAPQAFFLSFLLKSSSTYTKARSISISISMIDNNSPHLDFTVVI